jgi:cobalt-zinc-cadmium efflux system outer membrane protein
MLLPALGLDFFSKSPTEGEAVMMVPRLQSLLLAASIVILCGPSLHAQSRSRPAVLPPEAYSSAYSLPDQVPEQVKSKLAAPALASKPSTLALPDQVKSQPTALAPPAAYSLQDLINLSLTRNPALQQAGLNIQAAQGKAYQSGLYPNPTFTFSADELGDRTGPGGILAPQFTQEFVTGGKLRLNRAVAGKDVDQATLMLQNQRYSLFTTIRQGFFDVLATQRRVQILGELVAFAQKSQENAEALLKGKQIAELDVLPLQLEFHRLTAEHEASQREWVAAWRRLAASIGNPNMQMSALSGSLDEALPVFDFDQARSIILDIHPEVNFARTGIAKAELVLRRAEVEKIPNVTLGAGYVKQYENRSNDAMVQMSMPIPVFNRNQGNVQAARADLGRANFEVARVQNELASRLATSFGLYSAAKQRADRYRTSILPTATKSYELSMKAFKGGQFEYLRVIQSQRAISEANLEYIRALGDAWRAASEIAGLLLEEEWPPIPTAAVFKK